jgi:hypothetical protein
MRRSVENAETVGLYHRRSQGYSPPSPRRRHHGHVYHHVQSLAMEYGPPPFNYRCHCLATLCIKRVTPHCPTCGGHRTTDGLPYPRFAAGLDAYGA